MLEPWLLGRDGPGLVSYSALRLGVAPLSWPLPFSYVVISPTQRDPGRWCLPHMVRERPDWDSVSKTQWGELGQARTTLCLGALYLWVSQAVILGKMVPWNQIRWQVTIPPLQQRHLFLWPAHSWAAIIAEEGKAGMLWVVMWARHCSKPLCVQWLWMVLGLGSVSLLPVISLQSTHDTSSQVVKALTNTGSVWPFSPLSCSASSSFQIWQDVLLMDSQVPLLLCNWPPRHLPSALSFIHLTFRGSAPSTVRHRGLVPTSVHSPTTLGQVFFTPAFPHPAQGLMPSRLWINLHLIKLSLLSQT